MSRRVPERNAAPSPRLVVLLCLLVAAAALVVYGRVVTFPFSVVHDYPALVDSDLTHSGFSFEGARSAFTTAYPQDWRPLAWPCHLLVHSMWGADAAGYHWLGLGLHSAAAVLVFLVLQGLTGRPWPAALAACLFAVHPMHAGAVAPAGLWVYPQAACLGLASLWTYARYARTRHFGWYIATLLLLAAGHMSTTVFISWPLVFLLLDLWPLKRWALAPKLCREPRRSDERPSPARPVAGLLLEKIPFLAVALVHLLIVNRVRPDPLPPGAFPFAHVSCSIAAMLRRMAWPFGLSYVYGNPYGPGGTPPGAIETGACVLLLLAITAGVVLLWVRRRIAFPLVGWLWFLALVLPALALAPADPGTTVDRSVYLAGIGAWIVAAWGLFSLRGRTGTRIASAAAILVGSGFTVLGMREAHRYREDRVLCERALRLDPDNIHAHTDLARVHGARKEWRQCERYSRNAARIALDKPGSVRLPVEFTALLWHGRALLNLGRPEAASRHLERMLEEYAPQSSVLYDLGCAYLEQGKRDEAAGCFRRIIQRKPTTGTPHGAQRRVFGLAHAALGILHLQAGDPGGALAELAVASRLAPAIATIQYNFGNALLESGHAASAVPVLRKAVSLDPSYANAHNNLGLALVRAAHADRSNAGFQRGMQEAERHFRAAIAITPHNTAARVNLGRLLVLAQRLEEAAEQFRAALASAPDDADARAALDALKAEKARNPPVQ